MRTIAIVGAGQSGLQLGIGLQKLGFLVSLYTDRTAEQVLNGKILSSQGMFDSALEHERKLQLNFWDLLCPNNTSVTFTIADLGSGPSKAIYWKGLTEKPYQTVDQRLKFSRWMDEFQRLGGNLVIQAVSVHNLSRICQENELTILATGKGDLGGVFQRNNTLSSFTEPQRALSCLYVKGLTPIEDAPGVRANIIPGIGEYFVMPGLTLNGCCEMMLFEGIPGGPFDCWDTVSNPEQQLEISLRLLKKYLPWEAERCEHATVTDQKAGLTGCYTPVIKNPVCQLPSGEFILGLGDAVVLNDPIAGQGANNASKAANLYMHSILARGQAPFDEYWMRQTFNAYWEGYAQWATQWSNMLLRPPPPHVIELLQAAASNPTIAEKLANGFDNPASLFPWITSPTQTSAFLTNTISNHVAA